MYQKIYLEDAPYLNKYNKSKISFPIYYDEDLAFLGECIRVEGSLNKGTTNMSFSNSDVSLLKELERILKKFRCHIYKTLHVYVKIPLDTKEKDIKVFDMKSNKEKKFRIRRSKRFGRERSELIFIDTDVEYDSYKIYEIIIGGKNFKITIDILKESKISTKPSNSVSAVIHFIFANIFLRKIFKGVLQIPEGKKSKNIIVPEILLNSPKNVIASAISAVLACEGFLTYQKPPRSNRSIDIEMTSKVYLEGLKELFSKLGLVSYLNKRKNREIYSLHIYGKENLLKIKEYIRFVQPTKQHKFEEMLRYKEFLNREAESVILSFLKENSGKATLYRIISKIGRKERTVKRYLGNLKKEGKIQYASGNIRIL